MRTMKWSSKIAALAAANSIVAEPMRAPDHAFRVRHDAWRIHATFLFAGAVIVSQLVISGSVHPHLIFTLLMLIALAIRASR